ncbi:MAG TPA: DnaB-like helicase C-terminal domain-containing protein [Polyangiaceae bacterium]|nr:DnaB-like helicase C-terminal domain-containing protein [Polyangiaceae bacterium]
MSSSPAHPSTLGPVALANIQVDVTTRLGAITKPTATGIKGLDAALSGGLRHGTVLALTGAPGAGRTALALSLAYMAARASVGVVFTSRGFDETEVVARLAARALRKSYPASEVTYADILAGRVFANDAVRRAVNEAVDTVVQKVGAHLHFAHVDAHDSISTLVERSTQLWARYERVLVVVDDIEGLAVSEPGDLPARVMSVAYELRRLADHGCSVVLTALERHAEFVAPAVTLLAELAPAPSEDTRSVPLEIIIRKNRVGTTGRFKLHALYGATEFSEP